MVTGKAPTPLGLVDGGSLVNAVWSAVREKLPPDLVPDLFGAAKKRGSRFELGLILDATSALTPMLSGKSLDDTELGGGLTVTFHF